MSPLPRVYIGHGASGSAATMEPFAAGLRARGVDAVAIDLPKRRAEDAVPVLLKIAPPGPGIVRNRSKIDATIGNAAAVRAIQAAFGSFDAYLADRLPGPIPRLPATARPGDIPVTTPAAQALSADLRRHGLRFVGPTIVYAFMQSVGLVDDHLPGCFRYVGRH